MNNVIGFLLMIIIGCVVVVGCQEKATGASATMVQPNTLVHK